ncbi:MAG: protein kinase domain-containing protein, partial [Jatrophihabitans sp.]|uniref:protein kinase domain-containing protein n=1 Tax=Jatrophihabitans sp. TaxID=1932789 RepID=UPI003F7FFDC4
MTHARSKNDAIAADPRFADVELLRAEPRSAIYDARLQDGRRVLVKATHTGESAWTSEPILQEAALLGRVGHHPNIITMYEQIRLRDGRPALVLERAVGTLGYLTGAYRPDVRLVVSLGIKLAGALETLHDGGWLHTDVRPDAIAVTEWGETVLASFDEAVALEKVASYALHRTTPFTAPELLEGGVPCRATDVYGLAVTLYDILAGHAPYPMYEGEAAAETSLRILRGAHAPLPAEVPLPVQDLLAWGMSVDPGARPPSAAWFAEELRHVEVGQHWPRTQLLTGT